MVVDVQSGLADPANGELVSVSSLFFAGSAAKGILSSLVHVLVAAGELDYELRLAEVWPEFAAHGKGDVSGRQVLMHQAGVPGLPLDLTTERATGLPLPVLLRDHLLGPLGIADEVHFAVPAHLLRRVVRQVAPTGSSAPGPAPGSPLARAMPSGARPDAAFANRRDVLTAQIPSMGTMSARGAAWVYAALLGHVPGFRPLSETQLATAAAVAYVGTDQAMEMEQPGGRWATAPTGQRRSFTIGLDLRDGRPQRLGGVCRHQHRRCRGADAQPVLSGLHRHRTAGRDRRLPITRPSQAQEVSTTAPRTELDSRFSDSDAQPTSWEQTLAEIKRAELFWISTVRADGRPHVTPLVAVWLDDALHFSTGPDEQKALNIAADPRVALTTGANDWQGGLDVVIEGEAVRVSSADKLHQLAKAWAQKWDGRWDTKSAPMASGTAPGPRSCSLSARQRSWPSRKAHSATPATASDNLDPPWASIVAVSSSMRTMWSCVV